MKKSIATIVCAAFVLTGPGQLTVFAAGAVHAQGVAPISGPVVAPNIAAIATPSMSADVAAGAIGAIATPNMTGIIGGPIIDGAAPQSAAGAAEAITALDSASNFAEQISGPNAAPGADQSVSNAFFDVNRHGSAADSSVALIGRLNADSRAALLGRSTGQQRAAIARSVERSARSSDGASIGFTEIAVGIGALTTVAYFAVPRFKALVDRAISTIKVLIGLAKRQPTVQEMIAERMKQLEEAHPLYNKKVSTAEGKVASLEEELSTKKGELTSQSAELDKSLQNEELNKPKEGEKASDAYTKAQDASARIARQVARIEGEVKSIETSLGTARDGVTQAQNERESYFSERVREMNSFRESLTTSERAKLKKDLMGMREKYILTGQGSIDAITHAVDKDVVDGNAAEDKVKSDPRNGKVVQEEQGEKRDADDILAKRRKAMAEKNAAGDKKDGAKLNGTDLRAFGSAALMVAGIFQPVYATIAILAFGLGMAAFVSPEEQRRDGMWLAGAGVVTAALGTIVGLASMKFGFSIAIAGVSAWFIIPALAAIGVGIWLDYKGYGASQKAATLIATDKSGSMQTPAAAPAKSETPAAEPAAPAGPSKGERAAEAAGKIVGAGQQAAGQVAEKVVKGMEQAAEKAEKAAGSGSAEATPAPSADELAQRAKDAAGKMAGAAGTAIGAAAKQGSAAARQGADTVLKAFEQAAQTAAEQANAASAKPGAEAPSAGQLIERLKNAGLKLGDAVVTKIEQKTDPNAPKSESKPGFISLMARFVNAVIELFYKKADEALSKIEKDPRVLAAKLEAELASADQKQGQMVFDAAKVYETIAQAIKRGEAERKSKEEFIAKMLSPRSSGQADPGDEAAAKSAIAELRGIEKSVAGNLERLPAAKALMEQAIEMRLRVYAERAEALADVRAGLSDVELGKVQEKIAGIMLDYHSRITAINDQFKQAVDKVVVDGRAAGDSLNSDPREVAAKMRQRIENETVDQELARRREALQAKK